MRSTMPDDPILSIRNLHVSYGTSRVLFGVDLDVRQGEVVALLGRNGAGRSTTFKSIMGLAPPTSGTVVMNGKDFAGRPTHEIAQAGLAYVPAGRQVFPFQTVEDNLIIAQKKGPTGRSDWDLKAIYDAFPIVAKLQDRPAQLLSGGEQQLLTIARALMGNPDAILLDEPSEGLAPIIVQEIGRLIRRLKELSITILLAEQNMHFCLSVATSGYILNKGEIVHRDEADRIRNERDIINEYLSV
ncbi:ABC transporter ATP-binding protein [Methylobacterium tarhaniae]